MQNLCADELQQCNSVALQIQLQHTSTSFWQDYKEIDFIRPMNEF